MIVVDASAALSALLNDGPARRTLADEQLHAPHLIDAEVANGLRRRVASGAVSERHARAALNVWRRVGMTRYPTFPLLDRVWELRQNVTACDAAYVALAEALDCALVTADGRRTRAAGIRCPMTLVPR